MRNLMHNPLENIPTYEYDRRWEHDGIDCHLTRGKYTGEFRGYVYLPKAHPLYGKEMDDMEMMAVDVHGGITFAQEEAGLWKIGFDCGHDGDVIPSMEMLPFMDEGHRWTEEEAIAEVESLASEVREIAERAAKREARAVEDARADLPSPLRVPAKLVHLTGSTHEGPGGEVLRDAFIAMPPGTMVGSTDITGHLMFARLAEAQMRQVEQGLAVKIPLKFGDEVPIFKGFDDTGNRTGELSVVAPVLADAVYDALEALSMQQAPSYGPESGMVAPEPIPMNATPPTPPELTTPIPMNSTPPTPPEMTTPIPPYATTPAGPVAPTPTPPIAREPVRAAAPAQQGGYVKICVPRENVRPFSQTSAAGKTYKKAAVSLPAGTVVNGVDLSGRTAFLFMSRYNEQDMEARRAAIRFSARADSQIGVVGPRGSGIPEVRVRADVLSHAVELAGMESDYPSVSGLESAMRASSEASMRPASPVQGRAR